MAYVKPIDGYIVDVPNATYTRCDGNIFYFNKLNSCNFSPTMEPIIINGGQGLYPLAFVNAGASAEVQMTSSEFRADLFEMAHAVTATAAVGHIIYESKLYDVEALLKITLPVGATAPFIAGMEAAAIAAAGKFTFVSPTITFFAGDVAVGDTVLVSYKIATAGTLIPISADGGSSKGSLQLEYPVYSSGTDCTEASKKGALYLTVYRVRVSAMPGFDSSLSYRFPAQKCA